MFTADLTRRERPLREQHGLACEGEADVAVPAARHDKVKRFLAATDPPQGPSSPTPISPS
ncbi:hypothetical protein GCM10010272_32560 [Streptomyces lateritius]|nr:hypothetical protein GCM10010272_32560 [Streptomyces lateritius]